MGSAVLRFYAYLTPETSEFLVAPLSLSERAKRFTRALNAHEVADLLNISRVSVLRMAKQGSIPSFRVGNLVRFDPRALHDWLRKRAAA